MDKENTLTIVIDDPDLVLTTYDVSTFERSVTVREGPFSRLTEDVAEAATLLGVAIAPFFVVGKILQIIIDEDSQVGMQFTDADPLTASEVVLQINTALGASIATNESSQIRLTSTLTGTDSKIEIVGGSAASALGFTAGQRDIGADAHVPVVSGVQTYTYVDEDGAAGYWYRTRYKNLSSGALSFPSEPFQAGPSSPLDPSDLSLCTVDLVGLSGQPLPNRRITIYPVSLPLIVAGAGVDLGRDGLVLETDESGHAEGNLVRGSRAKVVFEGTTFIRTIDVPDQPTFDLLSAVAAEDDQFATAVVPNLPAAPRRTL